jgi:biotin synthase
MNDRVIEVQHKTVKVPHPSAETWSLQQVAELYALPFNDLLFRAQQVHREYFDANKVQLSTLLSVKTGGCPEDCGYCPQSARHDTGWAIRRCWA